METRATTRPTEKLKRRRPIDATNLTRKQFEKFGYRVAFIERCVSRTPPGWTFPLVRKFDAYGFADFLCFHPERHTTLLIQSTTWTNWAAHRKKLLLSAYAYEWLQIPGNRTGLIAWQRGKKRGQKARMKFEWMKLRDFEHLPLGSCSEVTFRK